MLNVVDYLYVFFLILGSVNFVCCSPACISAVSLGNDQTFPAAIRCASPGRRLCCYEQALPANWTGKEHLQATQVFFTSRWSLGVVKTTDSWMAINNFLCSDPSCSNRELISCIEYFTSHQSSQLLLEIEREFGPLEVAEVMEKLRLCNEFFPAFHAMVTELQDFLGENSCYKGYGA